MAKNAFSMSEVGMLKKRLIILLSLFVIVGGIFFYLHKSGYWSEQSKALRQLKKIEVPATPAQVQKSIAQGDVPTLSLLNVGGVDFNAPEAVSPAGEPPLHVAIKKQDWKTYDTLVQAQCDPDLKNSTGMPATYYLIEGGYLERAKELFENGAEANFHHESGEPALIQYLMDDKQAEALVLLAGGADPDAVSKKNESALYLALKKNDGVIRQAIFQADVDPNSKTPFGSPVFMNFCKSLPTLSYTKPEELETVQQFLDAGVDLNAADVGGKRAVQWLLKNGRAEGARLILSQDSNVTDTLWLAFETEDYTTAVWLLQQGADPNQQNFIGESPLHAMVKSNQPTVITELLNKGVDPEQFGLEGQSALVTAIALKNTEAALALLSHPTRPAQHTTIMPKPVTEQFRKLFGKKGYFDWYCRNTPGLTPLMAAVMRDELKVAEKLIANGADPVQGTENRYKVFPIQMASNNKNVKMQQLLIGVPYEDNQQVRNFVIDLSEQKVRYYKNGELIKTSRCSTGRSGFRTPPGNYVITDKTKNKRSNIYDDSPMPYFQRFSCGAIGFHEGNTYSRYASHGCIRLPMSTAKYFWGQTQLGDRVEIVK